MIDFLYIFTDFLTTTELAMIKDQETNTPVDALVFTTPMISVIVVFCSALVCIVLLRKLLYRALCRTKQPHLTVSDNISIKDVSLLTELSPYDDQREQNEHKLTTFDYSVRKQHTQSLTMDVSIERKLELYNVSTKSLNQLETLVPKT